MATDLRVALNSEFVNASMLTRPKASLPILYVYVEDDIDKLFWRVFLNEATTQCHVRISVFNVANREVRGKDAMMKEVAEGRLVLGAKMLVCVDADLDLIIDNYHNYTNILRLNHYVITTKWYAIENLKCSPQNIRKILYRLTLEDEILINVEEKLSMVYLEVIRMFLTVLVSIDLKDRKFSLDTFSSLLQRIQFEENGEMSKESLSEIRTAIRATEPYYKAHAKEIECMQNKLYAMGYSDDTFYQLMRGHDIADIVTKRFLMKVAYCMRSRKQSLLGGCGAKADYKKQLLQQYANYTGVKETCGLGHRIDQLLTDCTDFCGLPVYDDIQEQVRRAIVYGKVSSVVESLKKERITR